MAKSKFQQVQEAIQSIRELYALGQKIPAKRLHKEAYNRHVIQQEAARRGINEDKIRKARQFADPVEGYTPAELDELCRRMRRVQTRQEDSLAVFSQSHLIRLLSVRPKRRRAVLQREAIEAGWSRAELDIQIAERYGTRRDGGRRPRVPHDPAELLAQIEGMCEAWRRWHEELKLLLEDARVENSELLPKAIIKRVQESSVALLVLQRDVIDKLQEDRPGRAVRYFFEAQPGAEQPPGRKAAPSARPASRKG